ncbi:hypothetical protein SLS62_002759 [Diatrype stigma]|uniref:ATP synthase mitochondrial F1 complex assembly factor 1 n=1 Tax=Diatrype stigma TaxID=117547 RepID=A0AAN9YUW8_9PEZI
MAIARSTASALRNFLGRHHHQQLLPLRGGVLPASSSPSSLSPHQRRWAQVHDVRFLATTQASRSVPEKYREKLDQKAREEGLRDIDELLTAYADRIEELKKKDRASVPGLDALLDDADPSEAQAQAQAQAQQQAPGEPSASASAVPRPPPRPSSAAAIKPLSEILDLDKARALPAQELGAVWRLRHASSPTSLCAVIPAATYRGLEATARRHPAFVLPVPRAGAGAEMHYLQWVFDGPSRTATVLFTQLAEYKARGEWAQPHTSATHYWDDALAAGPAEAVLMAGSLVEGRGASIADAQWLVALLQRFYAGEGNGSGGVDPAKRALLEQFSSGDPTFSVEKLLEESEKLG